MFLHTGRAPWGLNTFEHHGIKEARKAAKKAKKKAAAAAAKVNAIDGKTPQQSSNEDKGLEPPAGKDEDPEGLKALAGEGTPVLEQAWKLVYVVSVCSRVMIEILIPYVFCDRTQSLKKFEVLGGLVSGTEESRGKISLDRPNRQWDYPYVLTFSILSFSRN